MTGKFHTGPDVYRYTYNLILSENASYLKFRLSLHNAQVEPGGL